MESEFEEYKVLKEKEIAQLRARISLLQILLATKDASDQGAFPLLFE